MDEGLDQNKAGSKQPSCSSSLLHPSPQDFKIHPCQPTALHIRNYLCVHLCILLVLSDRQQLSNSGYCPTSIHLDEVPLSQGHQLPKPDCNNTHHAIFSWSDFTSPGLPRSYVTNLELSWSSWRGKASSLQGSTSVLKGGRHREKQTLFWPKAKTCDRFKAILRAEITLMIYNSTGMSLAGLRQIFSPALPFSSGSFVLLWCCSSLPAGMALAIKRISRKFSHNHSSTNMLKKNPTWVH